MHFLITGGSGFIGSAFAQKLLSQGHKVTIFDDKPLKDSFRLQSIRHQIIYKQVDFTNLDLLYNIIIDFDVVLHFYARANTSIGSDTLDDFNKGIVSTYNIVESMRKNQIKKIIFLSGAAIYGNPSQFPTSEDYGPLSPLSLYASFKISAESLLSTFSHLFDFEVWIFRLGNVVGPKMTRGIIFDLIKKLQTADSLEILGNGNQIKDFIYLEDCIDGILFGFNYSNEKFSLFNLSSGTTISISEIAEIIKKEMNLSHIENQFTTSELGWIGDVSKINLDVSKIRKLGWCPKFDSKQAILQATKDLL
jgi:UDP-glucose 4-epimerase